LKKEEHSSTEERKLQDKERRKAGYLAVVRTLQDSSTDFKKEVRMICAQSNTDLHLLTPLIRLEFRACYVTKFQPLTS
jgi:hypothetical protein